MSFKPSEFPGAYERQCLRRINHAELFSELLGEPDELLAEATKKDRAYAANFSEQFEAILERAVALKPSEDTEVVLAVKAELDRLYTVAGSTCGDQASVKEGLQRLIDLTMQSVKRAAGNDAVATKELQEEDDARALHLKLLECDLVADLLNSHSNGEAGVSEVEAFIPSKALIPTLLSADKTVLADVVQLFDRQQVSEITQQAVVLLEGLEKVVMGENQILKLSKARENLEFIKGYGVYLDGAF